MNKNIEKKRNNILKLNKLFNEYKVLILLNINNISCFKISMLKKSLSIYNTYTFFIKKKLIIKYFIKYDFINLLESNIIGQTLLVFSNNDPVELIHFIENFLKDTDFININIIFINKVIYDKKYINFLSKLQSKKYLLFKIIYILKELSIKKFIRILTLLKNKI